jgi:ankyrin repeat protein
LHIAAENGNPNIVKLLLEHKADVLAKDGNGFTAMDIAEQAGHINVMILLRNSVGRDSFHF